MHLTFKDTNHEMYAAALKKAGHKDVAVSVDDAISSYSNNSGSVPIREFDEDALTVVYAAAKAASDKGMMRLITGYRTLRDDPDETTYNSRNFRFMPEAVKLWMKERMIRGWMFHHRPGVPSLPWLLTNIRYSPPDVREKRPAQVSFSFEANHKEDNDGKGGGGSGKTIILDADDVAGKTIAEILAANGMHIETQEELDLYDKHVEKFRELRPLHGHQFVASGQIRETSRYGSLSPVKIVRPIKVVNDEDLIKRATKATTTVKWHHDDTVAVEDMEDRSFVPFHCYLYCFALERHESVWVHVENLEIYKYDTAIRDQLVLPTDQTDLIDILVNDVNVMAQADIIEGKSEGTIIICRGGPGLGKTLTAEVYSEVVERPLYKIPAGLLGVTPDDVEKNLKEVLERAARWGAVPLIDEADVYIRARGDDLLHNAVVAVWLRVSEYSTGLLFLTTNRSDDIDDAILSRAAAIITYQAPSDEDARRIWTIHGKRLLGSGMTKALIKEVADYFPGASGRDIQRVTALAARVSASTKEKPSLDLFRKCAVFKGLRHQEESS